MDGGTRGVLSLGGGEVTLPSFSSLRKYWSVANV